MFKKKDQIKEALLENGGNSFENTLDTE